LKIQVCSVNNGVRRSGGGRWSGVWRASHLLAVDHEVGERADVGGAHEVGKEADVGGGGQQI
jgi:hypothetical protein